MLVRRLFKVLPDEGGKVLAFALLGGLLQAGVAIGMVAADSMFLSALGAEQLPLVFIAMPIVMALYAPVYSTLIDWLGAHGLFRATLAVLVAGGAAIGIMQAEFESATWFLFAIKLYAGLWFIATYTLFWNMADDYFSIQDGKRLYGLISAGSSAGAMLGGALVTLLAGVIPTGKLFLLWAAMALLTWPALAITLKRFKPIIEDDQPIDAKASVVAVLRGVRNTLSGSRFAVLIASICFFTVLLSALMEYLSMSVFAQARSADDLARLLGGLHALAGAATLIINLLVFSRLVGWLGVGSTALIVPLTYLGVFVLFYLAQGMSAAVVAFFAYQTLFVAVEYNNINLLYNALPAQSKRQVRTFVEAFAEPLATATTGGLLLYLAGGVELETLALGGLLVGCLAIGLAAVIRSDYVRSLAANLRNEWLDFANPQRAWRAQLGAADLGALRTVSREGTRAQRLLAVDLLWRLDDRESRSALLAFLTAAKVSEADQLRPAITALLSEATTKELAETLLWLESDEAPQEPEVLEGFTALGAFPVRQIAVWQGSDHAPDRAALAAANWHGSKLHDSAAAIGEARALLAGSAFEQRMGIRALGDFREARFASEILPCLASPDATTRLEAFQSLKKLCSPATQQIIAQVLPLLRTSPSDERLIILDIAERVADTSSLPLLLLAAEHFSAAESRRLEALIRSIGLKAIPSLIQVARESAAPFRSRSIALRALSRLALAQLLLVADELLVVELTRAQSAVDAHRSLVGHGKQGVTLAVLSRYYRDAAAQGLEFSLELLSLTGRLPDFELIRAMLSFSNVRDRANAIETIEQSCSRSLFGRFQVLIEATVAGSGLESAATAVPRPIDEVLRQASRSDVALEASAGMLGLDESGIDNGLQLIKLRLEQGAHPRLSDGLIKLLAYFTSQAAKVVAAEHPLQRIDALVRAKFFGDARIMALEFLAQHSEWRTWAPGEEIYAQNAEAGDLYVVADGAVDLYARQGILKLGAGTTIGQRVLMGDRRRGERAVSAGCRCVALSNETVMRAIEIFPASGVGLYQFKAQARVNR